MSTWKGLVLVWAKGPVLYFFGGYSSLVLSPCLLLLSASPSAYAPDPVLRGEEVNLSEGPGQPGPPGESGPASALRPGRRQHTPFVFQRASLLRVGMGNLESLHVSMRKRLFLLV